MSEGTSGSEETPTEREAAVQQFAGRLDAEGFVDPAEDLFYSGWISLLNAINAVLHGERSWARRLSQEAMLWAALSAEGRINAFLMGTLDGKDFDALERLAVPDRYAIGPRVAIGENLFPRGREPWQTLERLRRIRNDLVHPRPVGVALPPGDDDEDPFYADFNPATATEILLAVATATCALEDAKGLGADVWVERAVLTVASRVTELAGRYAGAAPARDPAGFFERQKARDLDGDVIIELGEIVDRAAGRD